MKRERGLAYCGLACCVCEEQEDCPGCLVNGCSHGADCPMVKCCQKQGIDGCYACAKFPCKEEMLAKPRVQAFNIFRKRYGSTALMDCLERNEVEGIRYHKEGITGDYDQSDDIEEIITLIMEGAESIG